MRQLLPPNTTMIRRMVGRLQRTKFLAQSVSGRQPLRPFQIEQYEGWLAKVGCLSDSDSEPLSLSELLKLADPECQTLWENLSLGYPLHVQGDPLLREQIVSEFYPSSSSIDQINCMAPQEGIFCALQALLETGDHVIVMAPSYQSLSEVPRSMGCRITHWLPDLVRDENEDPWFRFDPQTLRATFSQNRGRTKLLVVNLPHNPTGALPTQEEWQDIIEICREHGCYLFCDEMYRGLEHEGVDRLEPAVEAYERGISLSGLSKAFGLAGLRMGWVVGREDGFMKRLQEIKDYTTICTSTPSQVLSLVALRNTNTLLERCQRIVHDTRGQVEDFCREHDDILEWTNPRAGTFVFPKLLQEQPSARVYCDDILGRANIMLLPSSLFEYGEQIKDDSRVRISLGRRSIPETLALWKEHGL